MAWLIGIICVVIVATFWRVFLPIAVVAVIGISLFLWNAEYKKDRELAQTENAKEKLREKIAIAQQNASPDKNKWKVFFENDPASGIPIARTASIISNDGLCYLSVQERLDGTKLTGIDCWGMKIDTYRDIEIKFDSQKFSHSMRLEKYSDGDGVYIPSFQYEHSNQLKYDDFISMLKNNKSFAIKVPSEETFWTTFSLKNATEAVGKLGTQQNTNDTN